MSKKILNTNPFAVLYVLLLLVSISAALGPLSWDLLLIFTASYFLVGGVIDILSR